MNYIKNKYGNNARLLFTDTESLMYETKTEDVYEDFSKDKLGLKPKMYWYFVDDNSDHKKAKGVNKSIGSK